MLLQSEKMPTCMPVTVSMILNAFATRGLGWSYDTVMWGSPCAQNVSGNILAGTTASYRTLAALLECAGVEVKVVPGKTTDAASFREDLKDSFEASPVRFVAVNFERKRLGQKGAMMPGAVEGHYSPIGAYDAASDRVLVLDVARHRFQSWWAGLEDLFTAMVRGDTPERDHGYVVALTPPALDVHRLQVVADAILLVRQGALAFANALGIKRSAVVNPSRPLIYLNTTEGAVLLKAATHAQPFWQLGLMLQTQASSHPGPTTAAVMLNALGHQGLSAPASDFLSLFAPNFTVTVHHWEAASVFTSSACGQDLRTKWAGNLKQLAALIECAGAEVITVVAKTTDAARFRKDLMDSFVASPMRLIAVNFERRWLGQAGVEHQSPVGAYDAETDQVLVLDVARTEFKPWWVGLEDLFTAMVKGDTEQGYLMAHMPEFQSSSESPACSVEGCDSKLAEGG